MRTFKQHPKKVKFYNLKGSKFGRLTVLGYLGKDERNINSWLCLCSCGKEKVSNTQLLRGGKNKSCGCLHLASITTHGMTNTPERRAFSAAKYRCENPRAKQYHDYGGRGIKFLYSSFEDFIEDLGRRPKGFSLDRIDNEGNYEKGNCRWSSFAEQSANKRNSVYITIGGVSRISSGWQNKVNDSMKISRRINQTGWDPVLAVFGVVPKGTPSRNARKKAEDSIRGKTIEQMAYETGLKIPLA